jgi:hypothetical protein
MVPVSDPVLMVVFSARMTCQSLKKEIIKNAAFALVQQALADRKNGRVT